MTEMTAVIGTTSSNNSQTHSTQDEISFLVGMGTFTSGAPSEIRNVPKERRLALLRKYRMSMDHRERWDRVDPMVIRRKVDDMIARLEDEIN